MAEEHPTQEAVRRAYLAPTATANDDLRRTPHGHRPLQLLDVGVPDASNGARDAGGRTLPEGLPIDVSPLVEERLGRNSGADESHASAPIPSGTMTGQVQQIVRSLQARLGHGFDTAAIAEQVEAEFAAFSGAKVRQFVPIFVERRVWERFLAQRSLLHRADAGLAGGDT